MKMVEMNEAGVIKGILVDVSKILRWSCNDRPHPQEKLVNFGAFLFNCHVRVRTMQWQGCNMQFELSEVHVRWVKPCTRNGIF